MPRSLLIILAALVTLAAPKVATADTTPLSGAALKAACQEAGDEVYRLSVYPELVRPGATLTVLVHSRGPKHPWGGPVPTACMTRWRVSDERLARFSADHTHLTIAADAPAGATIRISARFGRDTVSAEFVVVAADAIVLVGYWTEIGDAACPAGRTPLRELHLKTDETFEATWLPFETYVDYWGDYRFDQIEEHTSELQSL